MGYVVINGTKEMTDDNWSDRLFFLSKYVLKEEVRRVGDVKHVLESSFVVCNVTHDVFFSRNVFKVYF